MNSGKRSFDLLIRLPTELFTRKGITQTHVDKYPHFVHATKFYWKFMTQKKKVSFCLDSSEREVISFFSPFLQGRQWRPICLQRRRAMGFERCCELGSWKVQDRSLHSVCSCEQFRGLDQTKAIK